MMISAVSEDEVKNSSPTDVKIGDDEIDPRPFASGMQCQACSRRLHP